VDFGCLASKCYANLIFNMERERERERERAQCLKSLAHLRSKFLFLKRASRSHAKTGFFSVFFGRLFSRCFSRGALGRPGLPFGRQWEPKGSQNEVKK